MRREKDTGTSAREPSCEYLLYECERDKTRLERRMAELQSQISHLIEENRKLRYQLADRERKSGLRQQDSLQPERVPQAW